MDVYLAVPAYRDRGINVSLPGGTVDARFIAEVSFARDELRSVNSQVEFMLRRALMDAGRLTAEPAATETKEE